MANDSKAVEDRPTFGSPDIETLLADPEHLKAVVHANMQTCIDASMALHQNPEECRHFLVCCLDELLP